MIHSLLHIVVLMTLPPLLLGIITKTKAFFAGRVGAPVLQPYYDLIRLFRKESVTSQTTTWVFAAGPAVGLVTTLLAGLMVPMGGFHAPLHFTGDLILVAYLLALGRFLTVAAALDTGSAFEGMGGAREVSFACLAEPALFFALLALARLSGSLSLSDMLGAPLARNWGASIAPLVLIAAGLFIVLLAENCRIPFDDPNTHLELTMIHEVMVLDHSGPALGVILYGASVKLWVIGAIVMRVLLPLNVGQGAAAWAVLAAGMIVMAVAVGVVESVMARLRMVDIPKLLIAACLLSGFGCLLLVRAS